MAATVQYLTKPDATEPGPSFGREELVTPERAREFLKRNRSNRKLSPANVKVIESEIRAGKFKPNGQSISFDTEGYMHDGQHRCHAIINTNTAVTCFIVYNVDPATRVTVDSGRKRTIGDNLTMEGNANAAPIAAAARHLLRYEMEGRELNPEKGSNRRPLTPRDVMERARLALPGIDESARWVLARNAKLQDSAPVSILIMCHYLFGQVDPEKRDVFFGRLHDGIGLEPGNPILALRERQRTVRRRTGRRANDSMESLMYVIKAWNHFYCGMPLSRFLPSIEFPQIIDYPMKGDNRDMVRGAVPESFLVIEEELRESGTREFRINIDASLAKGNTTAEAIIAGKWKRNSDENRLKAAILLRKRLDQNLAVPPSLQRRRRAEAAREESDQ